MDTALYFPYMRVPQSAWFSRILLYWDQAATIMPGEVGSSNQVTPYMRDLRAHRLLEFVDPERVVDVTGEEFAQRFLTMVDADDISVRRRNQALDRVHSGKLSWTLFTELRDRGLASQETGPHELWFRIERRTAGEYMAYLAGAIAGARPETYPVTDDAASLESAIRPTLPERLHDLRYALIEHALPAPSGPIPVRDLHDFKQRHVEELHRLRVYLDGELVALAALDPRLQAPKLAAMSMTMSDEVARLREQMERRRWPDVTLIGVGGVAGAVLGGAGTIAAGGAPLALGLALGASCITIGSAGYSLRHMLAAPKYDARAPLAYAAITSKAFPPRPP